MNSIRIIGVRGTPEGQALSKMGKIQDGDRKQRAIIRERGEFGQKGWPGVLGPDQNTEEEMGPWGNFVASPS